MGAEFTHEVAQKCRHCIIGNLAVWGKDLGRESDVGLGCGHLAGIAEAENTAEALLTDRCPDGPDGCANNGGRNMVEGVLPPRSRCPVNRVLQSARDGSVVFGSDEEHCVRAPDGLLQGSCFRRVIVVEVRTVDRQIADRYLGELKIIWRQPDQRLERILLMDFDDRLPTK